MSRQLTRSFGLALPFSYIHMPRVRENCSWVMKCLRIRFPLVSGGSWSKELTCRGWKGSFASAAQHSSSAAGKAVQCEQQHICLGSAFEELHKMYCSAARTLRIVPPPRRFQNRECQGALQIGRTDRKISACHMYSVVHFSWRGAHCTRPYCLSYTHLHEEGPHDSRQGTAHIHKHAGPYGYTHGYTNTGSDKPWPVSTERALREWQLRVPKGVAANAK